MTSGSEVPADRDVQEAPVAVYLLQLISFVLQYRPSFSLKTSSTDNEGLTTLITVKSMRGSTVSFNEGGRCGPEDCGSAVVLGCYDHRIVGSTV